MCACVPRTHLCVTVGSYIVWALTQLAKRLTGNETVGSVLAVSVVVTLGWWVLSGARTA